MTAIPVVLDAQKVLVGEFSRSRLFFVNPGKSYCLRQEALNKIGSIKMVGDNVLSFVLISVVNIF